MSIEVSKADAYFAGHVNGKAWDDFEEPDRTRAVTHAKRLLSMRAGSTFSEADTAEGDLPRWDVAVYEQAFHMLKHSHLPRDGESGAPRYLEDPDDGPDSEFNPEMICQAALQYVTGPAPYPRVEMRRG